MAYEVQLEERKKEERQHYSKKKEIAFHASSDTDDSDDNKEEMAMLSKKFRRFLKQGKFKCFNCDKPGHMKMDCPLLKKKDKYKSKKVQKEETL